MWPATSELGLRVALAIGLIAVTVTVGVVLQVLWMRLHALRLAREREALQARWQPLFARAALGERDALELPQLLPSQRADLLLLWNQLQDGLRGGAHESLNALALSLGLDVVARRWAAPGQRSMMRRVIGLGTLGHLGRREDWAPLRAALDDPLPLVGLGAARALLQIDAARAAPEVLDEFLRRPDWPTARLGTLLRDAGAAATAGPLTQRLLAARAVDQVRLLPLLRFAESPHGGGALQHLAEVSDDPQVLSIVLRQLHGRDALPHVRAHARHADALVRSAAAQALGQIGLPQDRDLLETLMSDRDWWVRLRAAQAQLALPGTDAATVEALRARLADPFARDAFDQARAEQALRVRQEAV